MTPTAHMSRGAIATSLALVLGASALSVTSNAPAAAQADSNAAITMTFKARSATLLPHADGSTHLELDGVASRARVDAPDAPGHVDPATVLDADADGSVPLRLRAAKTSEGKHDRTLTVVDVQYDGARSIAAVVPPSGSAPSLDSVPMEGTLRDVTVTATIDRPTGDDATAGPGRSVPAAASGSGGYTITMRWAASKYRDMSLWIFEPTSKVCVDNERATAPLTITYPTDGRGEPFATTDFALVVNNSGDCFWKPSVMEFLVKTGDSSDAGTCKYKVDQIGPRTFEASSTARSANTSACDASGGIDFITGNLQGTAD